jgi:hypothetical protein
MEKPVTMLAATRERIIGIFMIPDSTAVTLLIAWNHSGK